MSSDESFSGDDVAKVSMDPNETVNEGNMGLSGMLDVGGKTTEGVLDSGKEFFPPCVIARLRQSISESLGHQANDNG